MVALLVPIALFVLAALVLRRRDRSRGEDVSGRLEWLVLILACIGIALLAGWLL